MKLSELHSNESEVAAFPVFSGKGKVAAIQIPADEQLKKHITKSEAMLLCTVGEVFYETEKGERKLLMPGEYIIIEPEVEHWVSGIKDSQLVLIK